VAARILSVWRTDVPFRACVFGSLAGCILRSRLPPKPHEATRRACVLGRWFAPDQSCPAPMYSAGPGEIEEHQYVTYRHAGSYADFRVRSLYAS